MPGKDQLDALARTFGVPAGALLAELASTLRSRAHARANTTCSPPIARSARKQQGALLEVARSMVADQTRRRRAENAAKSRAAQAQGHTRTLLEPMQLELVAMARWLRHSGKRIVVLLEGRDTAGKGGVDRGHRRAPQPAPVPRRRAAEADASANRAQWYFQRYVAHLPAAGEIVLFDRSWYNRAGVEKVMGFASDAQVKAFLEQAPAFEKLLVDDGILLFKYWLCCDQAQQEERFAERARRSAQALEAVADRRRGARAVRRLHPRPRGDAEGHAHRRTRHGRWSISTTRSAAG